MSAECRDWLKTLWSASFKGVPFYFESDEEEGGRDNIKHVFPNRDDPFIEDMGESLRYLSGAAYVHGDDVDQAAATLKEVCATRGPGMLVVPLFGPVQVHCEQFKRRHERDRLGYVAFDLKFVRAGAASALISVGFAQSLAFGSIDRLAGVVAGLFPATLDTFGAPDYVVGRAADTLSSALAMLDVQRTSYAVDPKTSAMVRDQVADLLDDVPGAINVDTRAGVAASTLAQAFIDSARALGDGMSPAASARASLEIADAFAATVTGQPYISPNARRAADNEAAVSRMVRLAALMSYADAVMRTVYRARPDGVQARADVAARFEAELLDTTGAALAPLYIAIETLRGHVIDYLTRAINDLAPVMTVESARIRPSLDIAWILYGDPTRADELVARNAVRHPSFMPRAIEALAR